MRQLKESLAGTFYLTWKFQIKVWNHTYEGGYKGLYGEQQKKSGKSKICENKFGTICVHHLAHPVQTKVTPCFDLNPYETFSSEIQEHSKLKRSHFSEGKKKRNNNLSERYMHNNLSE